MRLRIWDRNPQFWSLHILDFWVRVFPQPSSGAAILNSGVPTALNLRSGRKNKIMRMISIFQKISNLRAMAVHAHPLTFYAPPRDSIAIPASLMRGEVAQSVTRHTEGNKCNLKQRTDKQRTIKQRIEKQTHALQTYNKATRTNV